MTTNKRPRYSICTVSPAVFGVLLVVGGLFVIGFLLVEQNARNLSIATLSPDDLNEDYQPTLFTTHLPNGCTLNSKGSIQQGTCSNRECACKGQDAKICCFRGTEHQQVNNLICPVGVATPTITNITRCGCDSCDDITIQVHVTVVDRDSDEPIIAALVIHDKAGKEHRYAGLTSHHGLLTITEAVSNMYIELKITASEYTPYSTMPIRLHPHVKTINLRVPMIPSMDVKLNLEGPEVILHLGSMASISAFAGSFHSISNNDTYEGPIRFKGMFVIPDDIRGLTGVPGSTFNVVDKETGVEQVMGVLFVTWLEFVSENGAPLTSEQLALRVSLVKRDGKAPPLRLITYNEKTHRWEKHSDFIIPQNSRTKRQGDLLVLENPDTPLTVLAAVATFNNINCWLQGRSFDNSEMPLSGPFITMEQRLQNNILSLVRFGTNTGAHQSSGIVSNAVCLPVDCDGQFISATVKSREALSVLSDPLTPIAFPPDTFDVTENAPTINGMVFSFSETITATLQRRRPFYTTVSDCEATGQDPDAPGSSYFRFGLGVEAGDVSLSSSIITGTVSSTLQLTSSPSTTPSTNPQQATPTSTLSQGTHTTPQQATPSTTLSQATPTTIPSQATPFTTLSQATPSTTLSQATPTTIPSQATPTIPQRNLVEILVPVCILLVIALLEGVVILYCVIAKNERKTGLHQTTTQVHESDLKDVATQVHKLDSEEAATESNEAYGKVEVDDQISESTL